MRLRLVSRPILLVAGAGAAASAVMSTARPFTWTADVTTAVAIAGVLLGGCLFASRANRTRHSAPLAHPIPRPGAVAWLLLVVALTTFELLNLFEAPRRQHPTISSLLVLLTGHDVTRALMFAAWLVAGWWLCRCR